MVQILTLLVLVAWTGFLVKLHKETQEEKNKDLNKKDKND